MLKHEGSKIFPPTPSELPDSSPALSNVAPSSEKTSASPNPQTTLNASETTSTDDDVSEDWETIEKSDGISLGAHGTESNEGQKIDSVDADVSGTLAASMNIEGRKKELAYKEKEEEKIDDAGSKAEVKHGLLQDW